MIFFRQKIITKNQSDRNVPKFVTKMKRVESLKVRNHYKSELASDIISLSTILNEISLFTEFVPFETKFTISNFKIRSV